MNFGAIRVHATDMEEIVSEDESIDEDKVEEEEMITASSYLYPFEEAVIALEELAVSNYLMGVVYLEDTVTLRTLPDAISEPVKNLNSGDTVRILGAGQDAGYSIWYQVSYQNEYEEVIGYLPKDNVVCVDSEFMQWQESYVRSIGMFGNMRGRYNASDIEAFPQSYQQGLYALKQKHPNWIFVKMNTQVNWENMLNKQIGNKSWIHNNGIPESYKAGPTPQNGWSYASRGIIRYYMDPRNWFSETYVFQFELLGFEPQYHTLKAVEEIIKGSFMANTKIENNKTYAEALLEIGRANDISPLFLAARILQEQGYPGTSPMISGTYSGYEGYYNYFNIGATGNGEKATIENGLKRAKKEGWNSRYNAIKGGVEFLLADYIRAGQNTLYLQKFDAVGTIATHQYMQNIKAPAQEASIVSKFYTNNGLLSQPYVFIVPVYNNMPEKACARPGEEDKITLSSTKIDNLQVDSEVTLQALVNGKIVEGARFEFISSDKEVATIDASGKVKALKAGETTITCKDLDDPENPNLATCKITVVPADIDLATLELPVLKAVTYNPSATLADIKLPAGYTWVNPEVIPCVEQNSYGVIYNPNEEKYKPITFDLTLEVLKRTLTAADYIVPTDLMGGAGKELSTVGLPVGFSWNDPTESLADTIGTKQYLASYNPDMANYETVTDIKITVTIVCEKHQLSDWLITEATCEEDGNKVRTCSICQYKEELILEKTGHSYDAEVTTEATEEAEGIRTFNCKNCNHTYTESIPKLPVTHVHQYEESITKKPSCTQEGEVLFQCSCGDAYTEIAEATGHDVKNGRCQQCGYADATETPKEDAPTGDTGNTQPPSDAPTGDTGNTQPPSDTPTGDTGNTQPPSDTPTGDTGNNQPPSDAPTGDTGNTQPPSDTPTGDTGNTQPPSNTPSQNQGGDKKEEVENLPPKAEEKVDEAVKNPTSNENKKDEVENVPPKTEEKAEETVKNPITNENKADENENIQPEDVKTEEETVNESTTTENTQEESKDTTTKIEETKKDTTNTDENKAELELMSNLVEMVDESEEDGEKKTVAIQLNKNTEISQKIVEMAKEHGVDLEVSLPNALKWTIKADSLGDGMPSSINLNAQIVNEVIEKEVIQTVVTEEEYMELSLSHDGIFGFEATLTIPVEEKYVGQTANLFYFNEKTKELEFIMASPVDEDGNVLLDFNHASDYVIVFAEKTMEDAVKVSETITENVDVEDNTTEDKQNKNDSINKLIVICIIILIVSGGIALAGLFLFKRSNESDSVEEAPTFEEWLKDDTTETPKELKKTKEADKEYFDDDKDDYREKEVAEAKTFHTGEIHLEEDYLDDDVDDYQEKN